MGLQQFERRLERLVEGAFAKAFRSGLTPMEVAKRLAREMDSNRMVGVRGIIVPNAFTIAVSETDAAKMESLSQALIRDLADYARQHARDEGYKLLGPIEIGLEPNERLGAGQFEVTGEVREAPGGGQTGAVILADGTRIEVTDQPVGIGRAADSEIVLSDPNVSRYHAEVRRDGEGFVAVDLESLNGTRVNGAGIKQHRLADGDTITVGTTAMRFELT